MLSRTSHPHPLQLKLPDLYTVVMGLHVLQTIFPFLVSFKEIDNVGVLPLFPGGGLDTSVVEVLGNSSITHTVIVKRLY